jgi:hypothetical protein
MQDQHPGNITHGNLYCQPFLGQPTLMYSSQNIMTPNQSPGYTPQRFQGMYLPAHPKTSQPIGQQYSPLMPPTLQVYTN